MAPHGVPHTYRVGDADGVFLVTSAPGTFVGFVREVGRPACAPSSRSSTARPTSPA